MPEEFSGPPWLDLGLDRFKHGKCPCCGKSQRESKGLEYRPRSNDLFRHTCKRRWPMELDLADLQREFSLSRPPVPDTGPREDFDIAPLRNTAGLPKETRKLRRLLKRIWLRR